MVSSKWQFLSFKVFFIWLTIASLLISMCPTVGTLFLDRDFLWDSQLGFHRISFGFVYRLKCCTSHILRRTLAVLWGILSLICDQCRRLEWNHHVTLRQSDGRKRKWLMSFLHRNKSNTSSHGKQMANIKVFPDRAGCRWYCTHPWWERSYAWGHINYMCRCEYICLRTYYSLRLSTIWMTRISEQLYNISCGLWRVKSECASPGMWSVSSLLTPNLHLKCWHQKLIRLRFENFFFLLFTQIGNISVPIEEW